MKETTPAAMPPCFDKWCQRFDDIWGHQAQKREFRHYLGGLLGESERKNLTQMADNGVVAVTSHLYDGIKSLPLDVELYQKADSLPQGNVDSEFKKKPEIALELVDKTLARGYRPGIVLIDAGYGNNTSFLQELEQRKLKYIGGIAKNRKVIVKTEAEKSQEIRVDELARSLPREAFSQIRLQVENPRNLWVATREIELSKYTGSKVIAIVMNAATFDEASEIDYLMTNVDLSIVTSEWIVKTYSQRNWIEVFYREAKGWLELREYQVRDKRSLKRHLVKRVLCLHFHSLAYLNRRIKTEVGKQTIEYL